LLSLLAVTTSAILVVDDDARITRTLASLLTAEGHAVDTAPDGLTALAKLDRRPFDVVITDVRMPELDGPGLYRELARRAPTLQRRIIFITGEAPTSETQRFLDGSGAPVLYKPFDIGALGRAVDTILTGGTGGPDPVAPRSTA
jgi:DNA-binding response OmpR family regulator